MNKDQSLIKKFILFLKLLNLKRGLLKNSALENLICKNNKEIYKSHCKEAKRFTSDSDGLNAVNNKTIDVYMSDNEVINYLKYLQPECDLKITGKPFGVNGYAFGIQKKLKAELTDRIDLKILDYYELGFLDELYGKWFQKRTKCDKEGPEEKRRIDQYQYKGAFAYLGIGLFAAIIVLCVEQILYKWTIPWLRSKPNTSQFKSYKLMFFSQVYRHSFFDLIQ